MKLMIFMVAMSTLISIKSAYASDNVVYSCQEYDSWFEAGPTNGNPNAWFPGLYTGDHVVRKFKTKRPFDPSGEIRFFTHQGRYLADCYTQVCRTIGGITVCD